MKTSIIIPIKNNEVFLNRCIESALKQTEKNIEIILIMQNMNSNTIKLCEYYKKKDKRIKVIIINKKTENIKNIAIKESTGNYITFLYPNDTIDENFVKDHIFYLKQNKADIVASELKKNNKKIEIYENNDIMKQYLFMNIRSNSYAKLFKKSLFKEIDFGNDPYYDDFQTMYKIYDIAKKVVHVNINQYHQEKITYKIKDKDYMNKINYCIELLEFIIDKYPELSKYCKTKICCEAIYLMKIVKDNYYKRQLYEYVKLYRNYAISDTRIPRNIRITVMKSVLGFNMLNAYLNLEKN